MRAGAERAAKAAALALALLLLASACGELLPEPSIRVEAPTASPSAAPTPSIVMPAGPAKTHMFGLPWTRVEQVRPLADTSRYNNEWTLLCYEGLFALDGQLSPVPALCESYRIDPEDGRRYTFFLRSGVVLHDGEPLTAADVVYSFEEALRPESPYASRFENVASVRALDGGSVEVLLHRPAARFAALLDFPVVRSGSGQSGTPAGTGPYSVHIGGEEGDYLLAFDGWWQGKCPPVARIELIAIESQDDFAYYFQNGTVSFVSIDPYDLVSPKIHADMEVWRTSTTNMVYLGFNTAHAPLNDPLTRKALTLALDRTALTKEAYGSYADVTALPFSPAASLVSMSTSAYEYDFGAASLLMEQIGYTDEDYDGVLEYNATRYVRRPFEIDILVNAENHARVEIAHLCAEQLARLGIGANVRAVGWEKYLQALESLDYGIYIGEVKLSADFSTEPFLTKNGALNYPGYGDAELDSLLEALAASRGGYAESSARAALYSHILETAPFMTLCFRETTAGAQRGLIQSPTPLGWNLFHGFADWKITLG